MRGFCLDFHWSFKEDGEQFVLVNLILFITSVIISVEGVCYCCSPAF